MLLNRDQIIKLLDIQDIKLIGSYVDSKLKYKSDMDLQCYITEPMSIDLIYEKFKKIFEAAKKSSNTYIIDFKCGVIPRGNIPIRWDYNDMMSGYQYIEDHCITFSSALQQKSVIKIDLVVTIDKIYHEYSCNYYILFDRINTIPFIERSILRSLKLDSIKLSRDGKYFKSLKRRYLYYKLKKNHKKQKELLKILNSNLGYLYKQITQLGTIELIIENLFKRPKETEIVYNLKCVRNNLPKECHYLIDKILEKKLSKNFLIKHF